jgi:uncharacterized GH25 family protein
MRLRLHGASRTTLITAAILTAASTAAAHDLWLVPSAFLVEPGEVLEVRGQTSSRFPTSEAAVSLDRIAQAQLIDAEGAHALTDLGRVGQSLLIRERPRTAGQKLVAVTLHPRSVRESAEGFRRYLVLEGAPEAAERYERMGLLPSDSVTRRYAKYAKTFVEVGRGEPRVFSRVVGHPLEFVPLGDPAALRAGDTLSVRLLFGGEPLAGVRVHAGWVPMQPGLDDEAAASSLRNPAQAPTGTPTGRAWYSGSDPPECGAGRRSDPEGGRDRLDRRARFSELCALISGHGAKTGFNQQSLRLVLTRMLEG